MDKETKTLLGVIAKNIVVIGTVVVAVANLWSATKLLPLVKDIDMIRKDVQAVEEKVETKVDEKEFKLVCDRIDRVQTSLNTLINLHIK